MEKSSNKGNQNLFIFIRFFGAEREFYGSLEKLLGLLDELNVFFTGAG